MQASGGAAYPLLIWRMLRSALPAPSCSFIIIATGLRTLPKGGGSTGSFATTASSMRRMYGKRTISSFIRWVVNSSARPLKISRRRSNSG